MSGFKKLIDGVATDLDYIFEKKRADSDAADETGYKYIEDGNTYDLNKRYQKWSTFGQAKADETGYECKNTSGEIIDLNRLFNKIDAPSITYSVISNIPSDQTDILEIKQSSGIFSKLLYFHLKREEKIEKFITLNFNINFDESLWDIWNIINEIIVVGGGGGGGNTEGYNWYKHRNGGGGGGAGGVLICNYLELSKLQLEKGFKCTIGFGGSKSDGFRGSAQKGNDTTFTSAGKTQAVSLGGGYGAPHDTNDNGGDGASGGGATYLRHFEGSGSAGKGKQNDYDLFKRPPEDGGRGLGPFNGGRGGSYNWGGAGGGGSTGRGLADDERDNGANGIGGLPGEGYKADSRYEIAIGGYGGNNHGTSKYSNKYDWSKESGPTGKYASMGSGGCGGSETKYTHSGRNGGIIFRIPKWVEVYYKDSGKRPNLNIRSSVNYDTINSDDGVYYLFKYSSTIESYTLTANELDIEEIFMVAGGGAGGTTWNIYAGGGGGAGGVLKSIKEYTNITGNIKLSIGKGGQAYTEYPKGTDTRVNGGNTTLEFEINGDINKWEAIGGGGGGGYFPLESGAANSGNTGGSGGGGCFYGYGGDKTKDFTGYGNKGSNGGAFNSSKTGGKGGGANKADKDGFTGYKYLGVNYAEGGAGGSGYSRDSRTDAVANTGTGGAGAIGTSRFANNKDKENSYWYSARSRCTPKSGANGIIIMKISKEMEVFP